MQMVLLRGGEKKAADAARRMKDAFVFAHSALNYIDFLQRGVNAHADWIFAFYHSN